MSTRGHTVGSRYIAEFREPSVTQGGPWIAPAAVSESCGAICGASRVGDIVNCSWLQLDPSHPHVRLFESCGGRTAMRFVLLFGCLSLSACAAFVTVRLWSLNRKLAAFAPIGVVRIQRSPSKVLEPIRR
jgi:hypothetical protein